MVSITIECATSGPTLWLAFGTCNSLQACFFTFCGIERYRVQEFRWFTWALGQQVVFTLDDKLESVAVFVEPVAAVSIEDDYFCFVLARCLSMLFIWMYVPESCGVLVPGSACLVAGSCSVRNLSLDPDSFHRQRVIGPGQNKILIYKNRVFS